MVSFQCEGCCDTVKKPKLDAHYARCHAPVSCIDCSKTFRSPTEFKGHTSCMTEAEKYEKSLYKGPRAQPGPPQPKGGDATTESSVAAASAPASSSTHPDRAAQIRNRQPNTNNDGYRNNRNGYNGGRQLFHGRQQHEGLPFRGDSPNFIKLVNERSFGSKSTSPADTPASKFSPPPSSGAANVAAAPVTETESKKLSKAERKKLKVEKKAEKASTSTPDAAAPPPPAPYTPAEPETKKFKKRKYGADELDSTPAVTAAPVATEEPAPKKQKRKPAPPVDGPTAVAIDPDSERSARKEKKKEKKIKRSTPATTDGHGDTKSLSGSAPAASKETNAETTNKSPVGESVPPVNGLAEIALDADNSARKEKKRKNKEEKAKSSTSATTDTRDVEMVITIVPSSLPGEPPSITKNTVPSDSTKPTKEKKHKSGVTTEHHSNAVSTGEVKPLEEAMNGAPSDKEKKAKRSRKSVTVDAERGAPPATSVPEDRETKPKKDKKGKGDRGLKEKKSKSGLIVYVV